MTTDHKELCERLRNGASNLSTNIDLFPALCRSTLECVVETIRNASDVIESQAKQIAELRTDLERARCERNKAHVDARREMIEEHKKALDRIAELEADRDSWRDQCSQRVKDWDDMRKERDALKADAERWEYASTMFFRMMSPDMGGDHAWVANGSRVGRGNTLNDAIDARLAEINVAIQAEKETRS